MTARAFPLEIHLACRRVADEHVERRGIDRSRWTRLRAYLCENAVYVLGDCGNIGVAKVETGHAFVLAGAADDRPDLLAVLIAQGGQRPEEAGASLVTSAKIGAVARGAIDAVDRLAAREHLRGRQR